MSLTGTFSTKLPGKYNFNSGAGLLPTYFTSQVLQVQHGGTGNAGVAGSGLKFNNATQISVSASNIITAWPNGGSLVLSSTSTTANTSLTFAGAGTITFPAGTYTIPTGTPTGTLLGITLISTSGTYTRNTLATKVIFDLVGGGGGSGGISSILGAGTWNTVGGGGAGNRIQCQLTAAQVGTSCTVTIGTAGAAGASGANNGGNGGDTIIVCSVGTITAKGGQGSATSQNAGGSFTFDSPGAGGIVGTSQGTQLINIPGQAGTVGLSGGVTSAGYSGQGGNSPFGTGGASISSSGAANPGTGFGAGASGALINGASAAGAAGTAGVVYIYEYA